MNSIYQIDIHRSITDIHRLSYQSLEDDIFPFSDYDFLYCLEKSGCLNERSGWHPYYICLKKGERIDAIALCFVKTNSFGEYIFDWAFADAYHRSGLEYYPKICLSIPFVPATGPKILMRPNTPLDQRQEIYSVICQSLKDLSVSSIHYLFADESTQAQLKTQSFHDRSSIQFWWQNNNYGNFSDFLCQLKGKKRRNIDRERNRIIEQNIEIKQYTGAAIPENAAERFYPFYISTIEKKYGNAYLTFSFFTKVFDLMKDRIFYCEAYKTTKLIGASLSFMKGSKLYGRWAGCEQGYDYLHFELCYYQLIEFAIAQKLSIIEAGAQGEHKHSRGFNAVLIRSSHWMKDVRFHEAIQNFLVEEATHHMQLLDNYNDHSPYKKKHPL